VERSKHALCPCLYVKIHAPTVIPVPGNFVGVRCLAQGKDCLPRVWHTRPAAPRTSIARVAHGICGTWYPFLCGPSPRYRRQLFFLYLTPVDALCDPCCVGQAPRYPNVPFEGSGGKARTIEDALKMAVTAEVEGLIR